MKYRTIRQFYFWLVCNYERLCLTLTDLDALHDAILTVVKRYDYLPQKEFEKRIISAYQIHTQRYYYYNKHNIRPDPLFFLLLVAQEEEDDEPLSKETTIAMLLRYVKRHFPVIEYRIFQLWCRGVSINDITRYIGLSKATTTNIINNIINNINEHIKYETA